MSYFWPMNSFPLFIISGPTASGKTKASIDVAKALQAYGRQAEIINFDSIIFYRELNIGSAKPSQQERENIIHHLIDVSHVDSPLNASDYVQMAKEKIHHLHHQDIIPILTGGSAFYLRALIKGMYESTKVPEQIKIEMNELYQKEGISPILDYLNKHDQESFYELHPNDHYRLMRAYEHHRSTGQKISEQKRKYDKQNPYDFTQGLVENWNIWHIYLDIPKEKHWEIIQKRTREMINNGLVDEVNNLLEKGVPATVKPLQSVGYKETIQYLNGDFQGLEDYAERVSISTRQLAKSQRTFFNKIKPKKTYNSLQDSQEILREALAFLELDKQGIV